MRGWFSALWRIVTLPFRMVWAVTPLPLRWPAIIGYRAVSLYGRDDCGIYAASIGYYALFSLVPLLLIGLAVFGVFINEQQFIDFIFDQFPIEDTVSTRERAESIISQSRQLSGIGLIVAFPVFVWSGSALFSAVRRGLDATQHERFHRAIWHGKLIDFAMMLCLGALVLTSIIATATSHVLLREAVDLGIVEVEITGNVTRFISFGLPVLLSFGAFLLMYRLVPSMRPPWTDALTSAIVATVLFEMLKQTAALFIGQMQWADDSEVYQGLGLVFGFLFWMYLTASIILFSAELSQAIYEPTPEIAAQRRERGQGVIPRSLFSRR